MSTRRPPFDPPPCLRRGAPTERRPAAAGGRPHAEEPRRRVSPPAQAAAEYEPPPSEQMDEDPDRKAVAERVLETAAEAGAPHQGQATGWGGRPLPGSDDSDASADAGLALYVMGEDGELEKVAKERFLIGRGKHCDLINQQRQGEP